MSNLAAMLRLPANLKSTQWRILAGPILILLILSMMVLPLPAFILDLLFTFNIALSIMVLLVAMFTSARSSLLRFRPSCCLPRCCVWH
ncbi:hypothetical protein DMI70_25870 [Escherichia coli]|nr:hypothetical protein [Escherichia coli]